jgi:hypothetical protein
LFLLAELRFFVKINETNSLFYAKKHCSACKKPMQRWGKTSAGKQRYFCIYCKVSTIRKRRDAQLRIDLRVFVSWITETISLDRTAKRLKITRQQIINRFKPFWNFLPQPKMITCDSKILVVDGVTIVKHKLVALIIIDRLKHIPLFWTFAHRESCDSWRLTLSRLRKAGVKPCVIVCDGQKGLLKAISAVWPQAVVQRCLIHISRQAKLWLTRNPKTEAGIELLLIVKMLTKIETKKQKRIWLRSFRNWLKKYDAFLKERTVHPLLEKRWWYTHKKLRAVRALLRNSLDNLFIYLDYPQVPKTSNDVEGGVNSRIKDLLRIHRGLWPRHQQVLAAWYLAKRQGQKPTQNFT